ncbi:hypothetical protein [Pseudoalteromonas phage J2-1_QLiu-2017]|nr:hypothetical protein [Pseudoalteromonas phage J2-1_QLiu-2017]
MSLTKTLEVDILTNTTSYTSLPEALILDDENVVTVQATIKDASGNMDITGITPSFEINGVTQALNVLDPTNGLVSYDVGITKDNYPTTDLYKVNLVLVQGATIANYTGYTFQVITLD